MKNYKKILIYLFLWSIPKQKHDVFTPYMAAFINKTCPYKITDRKIIKIEHNIIDSSRYLKATTFSQFFRRAKKQVFSEINTLQTKCVLCIHFIFEKRI
jgi:hypothetical protein